MDGAQSAAMGPSATSILPLQGSVAARRNATSLGHRAHARRRRLRVELGREV